jgi:hypothetical protein
LLFEAGPTKVRFRVCEPKGRAVIWYRKAMQSVPLELSELGAPSKVAAMVAGSAGGGPLTVMYVPSLASSI